jgi:Predicted ATPase
MFQFIITFIVVVAVCAAAGFLFWTVYSNAKREAKNYERGLKMIPMLIHLPPSGDDIEVGSRDERDVTEEMLSQAQVMYNIISSTATKGFKSKIYGQRHVSFEIIATGGLIHYYAVVPAVLSDVIKQSITAAYPTARLEEVEEHNIFSQQGRMSGTIGGEFTLKKDYVYPIATYQETKRDATRALLNAISGITREDGIGIQMMFRPASDTWTKKSVDIVDGIKKGKKSGGVLFGNSSTLGDLAEILWKPPESGSESKTEDKPLTNLEQAEIEAIEGKTRYPGYESLVRVVVSSSTAARSQVLLNNIIASFSLFDSPSYNGFKFDMTKDVDGLVTSFIFRFFPQTSNSDILNSVELASIFHLPNQRNIPTSQVRRQMAKQVDGPTEVMEEGFLLGVNEFRGVKKPIRLSTKDRRRHTYIIGQTGTGKSNLLENLAYQDMMDGKGFAFIDPHGDSAEKLLGMVPPERIDDVIYFNPSDMEAPVGLNLFEFETQDQRDFLIQEAIAMLYRLYDPGHTGIIGPRYEHWFRNAALTVMSDPNGSTFIDIPQVFNDQAFTNEKLKHVTDQTVLDFWYKEMAQTSEANKSEVLGWFVSKFGAFLSNEMMRNILGQTKSGFNLSDIMNNRKILLVNLSKGKTGELNSQLLGMIFVMKFQAAAMARANIPEDEREDFCLYVDEFQNFATDSFESILSEARKYRLNLVLANQFMTQLTDKIREAIIGNVGTVIAGRIGITDAEILQKKFMPVFDAEDLTKLPNYQSITSVMISNVPSAPFSMNFLPPMGQANQDLRESLKRYSAARYGRSRSEIDAEIRKRLGAGDAAKKRMEEERARIAQQSSVNRLQTNNGQVPQLAGSSTFLDTWIEKKQQLEKTGVMQSAPLRQEARLNKSKVDQTEIQKDGLFGSPDVPKQDLVGDITKVMNKPIGASKAPEQQAPQGAPEPRRADGGVKIKGVEHHDEAIFKIR